MVRITVRLRQIMAPTSGANLFVIVGAFLGPLVFGGLGEALSYRAAFGGLAVCTGVMAVVLGWRGGRCGSSVRRRFDQQGRVGNLLPTRPDKVIERVGSKLPTLRNYEAETPKRE